MKAIFPSLVKHPFRQMIIFVIVITMIKCEKESPVASVIISPNSVTIEIGGSSQFEATLKDASGNILTDRPIIWSSSNTTVATVSSTGIVNGISEGGPVTITATSEEKSSTAKVTVTPVPVATLAVSPTSITIEIGETKQLTTTIKDEHDNILTDRSIRWSSSNIVVTTVSSSGVLTGISTGGPVTITATCEGKSSTSQVTVIPASIASVAVTPLSSEVVVGENLQFSASVLDARGVSLIDRTIVWSSSNTEIATISSSGLVTGLKSGGPITITAMSEGKNGTAQLMVNLPIGVAEMFQNLAGLISWAIDYNKDLLINNNHLSVQIETKIEMLQRPTLASEIIEGSFYATDFTASVNGRHIPISCVFPLENMRSDANQSVNSIKLVLPLLEDFMDTPYPFNAFYDWYGFNVGNIGGGNSIYMWEKDAYEAAVLTITNPFPYEAVLFHELSHGYIGNEGLNQFLHIYLYNMIHTNSSDIKSWIYLQGYTAWQDTNTWVYALLDIYQLIGHENMSKAYKILYSLHPPYGSPLSNECLQVFINQAPEAVKDQVIAKVAKINP
jgi:uncharacterized protein YjdB